MLVWYQIMNNIVYTNLLYKHHYFIIEVGRKSYIRSNNIKPTRFDCPFEPKSN